MDIKVTSKYLRISPRKMRPALFSIRNTSAINAKTLLTFTNTKGAKMALDLLKSAMAIVKENDLELDKMMVKSAFCNEGPRLKRSHPKSKGSSYKITKKMSHLTIVIGEVEEMIEEEVTDKNVNKEVIKEKDIKVSESK